MVRTRLPCDVSKPVLSTMAIAPLSGGLGTPEATLWLPSSALPWVICRTLVPPQRKEFLSKPSGSMGASPGRNWIESFRSGVLSPDSMASFTIAVPSTRSMSQATPPSSLVRETDTKSPGRSLSLWTSVHLPTRYTHMAGGGGRGARGAGGGGGRGRAAGRAGAAGGGGGGGGGGRY